MAHTYFSLVRDSHSHGDFVHAKQIYLVQHVVGNPMPKRANKFSAVAIIRENGSATGRMKKHVEYVDKIAALLNEKTIDWDEAVESIENYNNARPEIQQLKMEGKI